MSETPRKRATKQASRTAEAVETAAAAELTHDAEIVAEQGDAMTRLVEACEKLRNTWRTGALEGTMYEMFAELNAVQAQEKA